MNRHHPWLSWPQLREGPLQVACPFCDALQESPRLRDGDAAYCCGCGHLLYRNRPHSLARAVSFSSAGLILLGITHVFPFLTMSSGSHRNVLTLVEAMRVFWRGGEYGLAVAMSAFTFVAPLGLLAGLLYVSAPLRQGSVWPGAYTMIQWVQRLEPWSMLEVFLLGILVSLQKLGEVADLHYGTGLWALAGVVLCTAAAMGGIDRLELWDRLEVARQTRSQEISGTGGIVGPWNGSEPETGAAAR